MIEQGKELIPARINLRFCLYWMAANILGYGAGLGIGLIEADKIEWDIYWIVKYWEGSMEWSWKLSGYIYSIVPGLILGCILALTQYFLLVSHIRSTVRWGIVTALSIFIGFILAEFMAVPAVYQPNCGFFPCWGGVVTPPTWLDWVLPWSMINTNLIYIGSLQAGLVVGSIMGFAQGWSVGFKSPFTWVWVIVNFISVAVAFLGGTIMSIFSLDMVIVSMGIGFIYSLFSGFYLYNRQWLTNGQ